MIRYLRTLPAVAFSAALLAAPLAAQDADYDARLAVAQDYVAATMQDMDMPRLIEQMWRGAVPQFERIAGAPLSDQQKADLQALYMEIFEEPMRSIMRNQDKLMADLLTLDEITALRDFYATPEGRSVMSKLPDIMARQQPQILELVQGTLPQAMPRIMAILQGQ
jgi:hypothetical protein